MTAEAVPENGSLEELDGTPIGPSRVQAQPAAAIIPWWRGFAAATAMTARRPDLWLLALVAFLARGGLALLVVPIVVPPTLVGIATFVGPSSVSAEGPGPRLVALIVVGVTVGLALLIAGTVMAAAAEVALHRATADAAEAAADRALPARPAAARGGAGSTGWAIARIAAMRIILLVPVAAAVGAGVPAWVAVAHRELTLPSEVITPLVVRILAGAPAASVAVLAAWLAAELVGGFAARRAALFDASFLRALGAGMLDPFRAPLGTALTVAAALGVTAVILAPTWWALSGTWDAARHLIGHGTDLLPAVGAALMVAAVWVSGLAAAALAAAWRATLMTMELLRRRR